jgi:hypothetical protein
MVPGVVWVSRLMVSGKMTCTFIFDKVIKNNCHYFLLIKLKGPVLMDLLYLPA